MTLLSAQLPERRQLATLAEAVVCAVYDRVMARTAHAFASRPLPCPALLESVANLALSPKTTH